MGKRTRGATPPPSVQSTGSRKASKGIIRSPTDPAETSLPPPRTAPAWLSEWQRWPIEELNTQLLQGMLRHAERVRRQGKIHPSIRILKQLSALDETERARIAKVPFVLLDAGFRNGGMWFFERLGYSFINMEDSLWLDGYDLHILARALFTFAWHFARAHPDAASIALGMSKQTTGLFAILSLRDLERVILQRGHWVRPRWESQPERWEKLLERAKHGDSTVLDQHALQLLYGDLFRDLDI